MKSRSPKIKKTVLSIAVSTALGAEITFAMPVVVNGSASYNVAGNSFNESALSDDGVSNIVINSEFDTFGEVPFFATAQVDVQAAPDGSFSLIAGGGGASHQAAASISYSTTVTNTSSTALDYTFDFVVNEGSLESDGAGFGGTPASGNGDFHQASYNSRLLLNGSSIWESAG